MACLLVSESMQLGRRVAHGGQISRQGASITMIRHLSGCLFACVSIRTHLLTFPHFLSAEARPPT